MATCFIQQPGEYPAANGLPVISGTNLRHKVKIIRELEEMAACW